MQSKILTKRTMPLQSTLSAEEEADCSVEIVATVERLLAVEAEKKQANKDFNAEIKALKSKLVELNEEKKSSIRITQHEVEDRLEDGKVRTYRTDTGELVAEREAFLNEKQEELPHCITSEDVTGVPDSDDCEDEDELRETNPPLDIAEIDGETVMVDRLANPPANRVTPLGAGKRGRKPRAEARAAS